jgi:hypothetical protein
MVARGMGLTRALLFFALICGTAGVARAEVDSPDVLAGVAAYNDLDYDKAIDRLQKALRTTLTRQEKLVAYKTLASCHYALGKRDLAVLDFQNVLRIDDAFELGRGSPPAERAALEVAKARVATGRVPSGADTHALTPLKPEVTPKTPLSGKPVSMRVFYPGGLADKMSLFYRTRGFGIYNRLEAAGDTAGHFSLTVPAAQVQAPGIEYYLVAFDDSGASVAKAGSLARPWLIDVSLSRKPIYKRGWFWGVFTGVLVAGAGVATALVLTRNQVTSTTPTTVTVSPF